MAKFPQFPSSRAVKPRGDPFSNKFMDCRAIQLELLAMTENLNSPMHYQQLEFSIQFLSSSIAANE